MHGYRYSEIDPFSVKIDPLKIKTSCKILAANIKMAECPKRLIASRTLPIYLDNSAEPKPCSNHPPSIVMGILKRFATQPPKSSPIVLAYLNKFVRNFCETMLEPLTAGDAEFDTWIEQINQPAFRKEELKAVWTAAPYDDPAIVFRSCDIKSFVKDEFYPDIKPLRCINARDDWFKCCSGPLFDAISKKVFSLPYFIKKVPVLERPTDIIESIWDLVSDVINADATSYEAHFIEEIMDNIEFVLYDYMTERVPDYHHKMSYIKHVLKGPQLLKFKFMSVKLNATRMSGEMNTSLGNGFTTLMLNMFLSYIKNLKMNIRAEGDDNLSKWQKSEFKPTAEEWEELGWIMKIEEPREANLGAFCGNVFDVEDKIVVTDPRTALRTFGWTGKRYVSAGRALQLQLLRSKALSLSHQYNGCPLLGAFGRRVEQLTRGITIRKSVINCMEQYKREQAQIYITTPLPDYVEPPMATRLLVENLYGINIKDQLSFESSLTNLELDSAFSFPWVEGTGPERHFHEYTSPVGEPWFPPAPEDEGRIQQYLFQFGKTTEAFNESYFRL